MKTQVFEAFCLIWEQTKGINTGGYGFRRLVLYKKSFLEKAGAKVENITPDRLREVFKKLGTGEKCTKKAFYEELQEA